MQGVTTLIQWFSVGSFIGMMAFIMVSNREVSYNEFKVPVVEDKPSKSEPRPVYPPLKKKPYTRSTRVA
jgi:hypothetical protein